uniref:Calcyphosine n=1 Tax=Saimiri boliviensis boliviensis TaxID=39432 RepID=A0A2K6UZQ1_SAIBB
MQSHRDLALSQALWGWQLPRPSTVHSRSWAPPRLQRHLPLATVSLGTTQLTQVLAGRTLGQNRQGWACGKPRPSMDAVDATMEKLRAQCLSRGTSGIQGLARFFRRLDRDGSRSLDADEFRQGLAKLGLVLDQSEAEGVCRRWDRDGSGTLDLEEFLRALRVRPHPEAKACRMPRCGDRGLLPNSCSLCSQVTLAEFQDYYSGVSASMNTDEEFVAMMTSAWQL